MSLRAPAPTAPAISGLAPPGPRLAPLSQVRLAPLSQVQPAPLRLIRTVWMLLRPPAALVLFLFAALGSVRAAPTAAYPPRAALVALLVAAWFVHATALNDLADEQVDRVNLLGARGRPLLAGVASRRELAGVAAAAGVVAVAAGAALSLPAAALAAGGLAANAAYSRPPLRLCARGGLAAALLPLGYVCVPYLAGASGAGASRFGAGSGGRLGVEDAVLIAGLYVSFVGRIVLKDFRDVAGDERFGKRTFLLRRGRVATCRLSALCLTAGSACVLYLVPWRSPLAGAFAVYVACALYALRLLAVARGYVAEQVTVGAVAGIGRGMTLTLVAHYSLLGQGWDPAGRAVVTATLAALVVGRFALTLAERETAVVRPY